MTDYTDSHFITTADVESRKTLYALYPDFFKYCKDSRVRADFTVEDGYVVIKGESRGRVQYIASRYFGTDAKAVTKVEKPKINLKDYECSACTFYCERMDRFGDNADYCNKLNCFMSTSYTCKHFKAKER